MPDIALITAAITSVRAAAGTLQALTKLKLENDTATRINDAHQQVSDVQQKLADLINEIYAVQKERDELQQQLRAITDWETERAGYKLAGTAGGAFIWESVEDSPKHYVCPVCFADKKLIPLQKQGDYTLHCPSCKKHYLLSKPPPITPMERRSIRFGKGAW